MFENQPQQFVPDYLANQKALGSLFGDRATNYLAEQEGIRKDIAGEAALPETLLKSKLGAMTTQGKIDTFGQEENIRKQDLSRTEQFNSLRAMRAMLDDPTFPDDQLVDYAVGAVKLIAKNDPNHNPDAKLADAKRSAVWSHLEEAARQNPRGIKGMLEQAMKWYAMDMPTTNDVTKEDNKGYNTQVNTLLNDMGSLEAAWARGSGDKPQIYKLATARLDKLARDENNAIKAEAAAKGIELVTDSAGRLSTRDPKDGKVFEGIRTSVEGRYAPEKRAAEDFLRRGEVELGYVRPITPAAPVAPAPVNKEDPLGLRR